MNTAPGLLDAVLPSTCVCVCVCHAVRQTAFKSTRVIFMKHRAGYVMPMLLQVSTFDDHIVAVAQKLNVSEQYIWVMSSSLKVCAATQEALRMLGVRSSCLTFASALHCCCRRDLAENVCACLLTLGHSQVTKTDYETGEISAATYFEESQLREHIKTSKSLYENVLRHELFEVGIA